MGTWGAIISLLVGCGLGIWRRQFAALAAREQTRMWGFRYGEREVRIGAVIAALVGLGFLAIGILALLGVLHWKPGTF